MIDNLLKGYKKREDLIGENGLLRQLTKRLLERAIAAEMTEHVGYEKHEAAGDGSGNSRNGNSAKTIKGTFGTLPIEGAARPERDVRAANREQASEAVHGGSTTTSFRCMRVGCRHGRYSSIWRKFTRLRCRRG